MAILQQIAIAMQPVVNAMQPAAWSATRDATSGLRSRRIR